MLCLTPLTGFYATVPFQSSTGCSAYWVKLPFPPSLNSRLRGTSLSVVTTQATLLTGTSRSASDLVPTAIHLGRSQCIIGEKFSKSHSTRRDLSPTYEFCTQHPCKLVNSTQPQVCPCVPWKEGKNSVMKCPWALTSLRKLSIDTGPTEKRGAVVPIGGRLYKKIIFS